MRWPWRRRHNGEAAKEAKGDAEQQYREAEDRSPRVEQTARTARELTRSADRFSREFQRSMHIRRGPA